jgi:23S rRNA pseudouridine1911/1915/1917 synthase
MTFTKPDHEFVVEATDAGLRADAFLAKVLPDLSRTRIQTLLKNGSILINRAPAKPSAKLEAGDLIQCGIPEPETLQVKAESMDLDCIYEDSDILVINKPQGVVVHPAAGNREGTLVSGLLHHCEDLSGINGVMRPGIVHRLDKDTSGLLVVAKNDLAHHSLAAQIQDRSMKREYIALVHGIVGESAGIVDVPIGRDPKDRQRMAGVEGGKPAVTHYRVLDRVGQQTVLLCSLETGRTHQIRVHMAYLGYPVAGDPKYGRRKELLPWTGQALHAWHLHLRHPRSGKDMDFYAPPPPFFLKVLSDLGAENTLKLLKSQIEDSSSLIK